MRLQFPVGTVLALITAANAFYLPGAAPHDYHEGDKIELFVNALTPMLSGTDDAKLVSCATRLGLPLYEYC